MKRGSIDIRFNISSAAWSILYRLDFESYSGFEDLDFSTAPFYNGRERGFVLTIQDANGKFAKNIAFAECRNSDVIVVYSWVAAPWALNPPMVSDFTEEVYNRQVVHSSVDDACDDIRNMVREFKIKATK